MNIPLFKVHVDQTDIDAVAEVVKSGQNWALGSQIDDFEKSLALYVGAKYALTFSSGTAALHASMLACDFGLNDEVIVPSFSFIATANAPLFVGAKPVFSEIEPVTFGLDVADIEKKITKKTKAIMVIHYAGRPCFIEEIKAIAKKHALILIEDAAGSLGASVNKKKIGTFGDIGVFSFCGPKILATGEGGAIVTDNEQLYEKMKLIRSHGRLATENYFTSPNYLDYVSLGYNFRMSTMIAALGLAQLKKIDTLIAMRKENAEYLNKAFADSEEISLLTIPSNHDIVYQLYSICIKGGRLQRDALKKHLNEKGIVAKIYFEPIHMTSFYQQMGWRKGDLPHTEKVSGEMLTLPMYPDLTKDEMDYIVTEVKAFFHNEKST